MTDLDLTEFYEESKAPHDKRCTVATIREQLDDNQRERLDAAFAHNGISGAAIQRVLNSWGHDISVGIVRNHRRGGCQCPKN